MEHRIEDIIPTIVDGQLKELAFTLVSTEGDLVAQRKWHTPAQLKGVDYPVQADYEAKCREICELVGLYAQNEGLIRRKQDEMTPSVPETPELDDESQKRVWVTEVDNMIAGIITRHTRFQMGYTEREAAALAFKNAGYTGDPTVWVTRFADNVKMPYKAATDLILAQASQLRAALKELEALRMDKYLIQSATTRELASAQFSRIIRNATAIGDSLK